MGYQVPTYTMIKENGFYYIIGDFLRKGPYQTKWGARRALYKLIKEPIVIEQYDEKGRLINE